VIFVVAGTVLVLAGGFAAAAGGEAGVTASLGSLGNDEVDPDIGGRRALGWSCAWQTTKMPAPCSART